MKKTSLTSPVLRFAQYDSPWVYNQVSEVTDRVSNSVDVNSNSQYREIGIRSHGKGIFYKAPVNGEELGNKRVYWIKKDAFVVNIVFAWEHAIAKTTKNEVGMIASHRFPMYLPKEERLDLDFLLYLFLRKRGKYLLELASPGGAGRNKTLGQKAFGELEIALPDIGEQKKIVSFLSTVDVWIDNLEKQKESLEAYKKSMMQKIFSQKIRFKDENGKGYPEWQEKSLGKIGKTYNGLTGKNTENFGSGRKYIQYKQIFSNSKIDLSYCGLVQVSPNENQNKASYGDVFFTTSSETPGEVAFSSVLLEKISDLYLNSFCFGYKINDFNELLPKFAQYLFRNHLFRKMVHRLAQGSTRYNISKTELMKLSVSIPTLVEQKKIAKFLSSLDELAEFNNIQINKAKEWKKGLLQQMFV